MNRDVVAQQVAGVAAELAERTDELALGLARAIRRNIKPYKASAAVPFEVLTEACVANVQAVLAGLANGSAFDTTAATRVGVQRARDGVPLPSVMEAYRIGFGHLLEAVLSEATAQVGPNGDALPALTAKTLAAQELFTTAMAMGYRNEQSRRLLDDEARRSSLIDTLLHGRLLEQWSLWEVADYLGLPSDGPFVVVAAEVTVPGTEALPGVESKLRSLDVFSAWRLLPDVQVGIVHMRGESQRTNVVALLSRLATARVGVSSRFDDLADVAQGLRYARVAMRGRAESDRPVTVFDGSILGTAAVSAPEVMTKLVTPVLEGFTDLSDEERDVLFETFRAWLDNGGSLRAASEMLFCHPNTVRYRLRRIEQRTGRSLSRPRDVAELCLVLEVYRRLM